MIYGTTCNKCFETIIFDSHNKLICGCKLKESILLSDIIKKENMYQITEEDKIFEGVL